MRSTRYDRVEVYARAVSGLLAQEADGARLAKHVEFIDICAGLTDNELPRYRRLHAEEDASVTGFFQRARDEGRAEGIMQGIKRDCTEVERAVLARLLARRLGRLAPEAAERLQRAPETELEAWADNVLDAEALDNVFRSAR